MAAIRWPLSFLRTTVGLAIATAVANAQVTTRVSVDSAGAEAKDACLAQSMSADGRFVVFTSTASNLVSGDTNGFADIFVHDRSTGITERVSVSSSGAEGNAPSGEFKTSHYESSISSDGQFVAFTSDASNLIAVDNNGVTDVFVHDRSTKKTTRVSKSSSGSGGNGGSFNTSISSDGQTVAFMSTASNLVSNDTNGMFDIFVHDRTTAVTTRVSVDSSGQQSKDHNYSPSLSADGMVVAFTSFAPNLVTGDGNNVADIFVHDRATKITERVSIDSSGMEANRESYFPSISGDATKVVFPSAADNLVANDSNKTWDIFVHDRSTGLTDRVSVDSSGIEGDSDSYPGAAIASDGNSVVFTSFATNLVAGDGNGVADVFVHDLRTGLTDRVSVDTAGTEGDQQSGDSNPDSYSASISADGLLVAFTSLATNLVAGDGNGLSDVFVRDLCSTVASWSNYGTGFPGANGIPTLTVQAPPILGTTLHVDVGSSASNTTLAVLLVGLSQISVPMAKGGDLLVLPLLSLSLSLPPSGLTIDEDIDSDPSLCAFELYVQTLVADPGAAKKQSASAGLKLVLGR